MSAENMGDQSLDQNHWIESPREDICKSDSNPSENISDKNQIIIPEVIEEKKKKRKYPAHLWKKGQSGNPIGKPKGCGLKDELLRQLNKKGEDGVTLRKKAVKKLLEAVCAGEPWANKILWDISGAADTLGIRNTGPLSIKFNIDGD